MYNHLQYVNNTYISHDTATAQRCFHNPHPSYCIQSDFFLSHHTKISLTKLIRKAFVTHHYDYIDARRRRWRRFISSFRLILCVSFVFLCFYRLWYFFMLALNWFDIILVFKIALKTDIIFIHGYIYIRCAWLCLSDLISLRLFFVRSLLLFPIYFIHISK